MNINSVNRPARLPMAKIVEYLEDYPMRLAEIALELRNMVLAAAPQATETICWRVLSYHDAAHGGIVKGAICQISLCADQVRLSFIHGVRLPDPSGILQGDRKSKRFVLIRSMTEVRTLPIAELVRSAADCVIAFDGNRI